MYVTVNLVELVIDIFATVTVATIVGFVLYDRYGHKK